MLDPTPVRRRKRLWALAIGLGTLLLAMALATRGLGDNVPPIAGVVGFLYALMSGGVLAAAYLFASVGLGALVSRIICGGRGLACEHRGWLALAVGPGLMLFLSHTLGVLGLLSGPKGQWIAIAVLVLGGVLFLAALMSATKSRPNLPPPPMAGLLWMLPAAIILVAASNPPGWLWGSEAAGYDALSYHLQLPQEWAAGDRLWPLQHNVYSFLPGYVEAGFMHLAAALGAGHAAVRPGTSVGLLAFDGAGAMGCQFLHAGFGVIAALLTGRVVYALLKQAGLGAPTTSDPGGSAASRVTAEVAALAGAVLLALPWMVVVSSMAYTEAAVNAMMAGGMLVALDSKLTPWRRGLLAGLLVGLACGCKPTAAFMVAPVVGLLLLGRMDLRRWPAACAAGTLAAAAMVLPFLLRNWLASGNPVFPAATTIFGTAHWTTEQAARFAGAHSQTGSLADRLGLLLATQGTGLGAEPRGIFHSQWAMLWPVGIVSLLIAGTWRPIRREVLLLALGLAAGLVWWLLYSHGQSRFLLPMAPVLALAIGLAMGRLLAWWQAGVQPVLVRLGIVALGAVPLFLAAASAWLFLSQQQAPTGKGSPNALLPDGTSRRVGEYVRAELRVLSEDDRTALMNAIGPEAFVNNFVTDGKIALIGGATPFYFRGSATGNVISNTTWDQSPLGAAMQALPQQPHLWADHLRARGIEYVLVDFSEVARLAGDARLARDNWSDPNLTLETVAQWILTNTEKVREWHPGPLRGPGDPRQSLPIQGLYRLRPSGGTRGQEARL